MKRIISILLIFASLIALSACSKKVQSPVNFYYTDADFKLGSDQSMIVAETRDAGEYKDQYTELLSVYFKGPIDPQYNSPFPSGTSLVSLEIGNTRAFVVVSQHLSMLNGHQLTIACACIGKTLLEMVDVRSVEIKAKSSLLNGMQSIILSENDLFLWDSNVGE